MGKRTGPYFRDLIDETLIHIRVIYGVRLGKGEMIEKIFASQNFELRVSL